MKKISIFTFWREENYGAILQATALHDTLQHYKNLDVELISFNPTHSKRSLLLQIRSFIWNILRKFLGCAQRNRRSTQFRKRWITSSPKLKSRKELFQYLIHRDVCVVGSDQVWNPQMFPKGQNPFLLCDVDTPKKVSYAASFGVEELDSDESSTYERALRQFSALSVREDAGVRIVQKMDLDALVVLDPTLLL